MRYFTRRGVKEGYTRKQQELLYLFSLSHQPKLAPLNSLVSQTKLAQLKVDIDSFGYVGGDSTETRDYAITLHQRRKLSENSKLYQVEKY